MNPADREAEAEFLARYDPKEFAGPSVAVDVALIGILRESLAVLVVRRKQLPFRDAYALPGGFVRGDESLATAAERVLAEKAGLRGMFLEQLFTFGEPKRDPRMRVISVAYYALVDTKRFGNLARPPETILAELSAPERPTLAFDHDQIVTTAVERIRGKLDYAPIGYELLPRKFTLLALQRTHEIVAGRAFNKDSFRRKMLATGMLEATGDVEDDVGHRPAALYRYVKR